MLKKGWNIGIGYSHCIFCLLDSMVFMPWSSLDFSPHISRFQKGLFSLPSFQSCLGLCYRFAAAFMLNLCGSIHENRGTQQDIFNVMGALYATVIFLGITNASTVQPIVAVERSVFYRERAAGMYAPMPYAIAQVRTKVQTLKLLITASLLWRCTGTPWQCLEDETHAPSNVCIKYMMCAHCAHSNLSMWVLILDACFLEIILWSLTRLPLLCRVL